MEPMTPKPGKSINEVTQKLDEMNAALATMKTERDKLIAEIRNSAREAVVVFVDMVGSTKSKLDHAGEPEVWLFKVQRFYQVAEGYIKRLGGRVVKYIGDEVMAVFDGNTMVNDSANCNRSRGG